MKEQALEIVSKLIDQHKITGQEAVILINSIVTPSCNYIDPNPTLGPIKIQPYGTTTTCDELINKLTSISNSDNKDIIYG